MSVRAGGLEGDDKAAPWTSWFARAVFRSRKEFRLRISSPMRKGFWRCLGMRAGAATVLSRIHVTWPHQVALGASCCIEPDCYFKFDGIYAPGPRIVIGDGVFIGRGCEFNIRRRIEVGDNCLIASRCYFVDHDHGFASRSLPMGLQSDGVEAAILIEDDVWIGAGVVVLKGVRVGCGAIIAAGSVLTRSVGAYEVWGGVPARKLRDRPG